MKNEKRTVTVSSRPTWSIYDWFSFGERGLSSEAMMRHIYKLHDPVCSSHDATAHPYDPADFRRCRLALENTKSEHLLEKCRTLSLVWNELINIWPELCATMDFEAPRWRDGKGKASETLAKMTAARDRAYKAMEGKP